MKTINYPILTEKSASQMDSGLYVFSVSKDATKKTVADELKQLYNVEAISVRMVNLPEKRVTFRRKSGTQGVRSKAYVQLKEKQHIPGFEALKEDMKKAAKEANKQELQVVKETK